METFKIPLKNKVIISTKIVIWISIRHQPHLYVLNNKNHIKMNLFENMFYDLNWET